MSETIFVHYGAADSGRTRSNLYNTLIILELPLTFLWPKFCCRIAYINSGFGRPVISAEGTAIIQTAMEPLIDSAEWYERGLALRKAGLFKQAIEQFEKAASDHDYALKAHAQIGLCYKSSGRYEAAVLAFRKALQSQTVSAKETVQILYVLGRTLESLGRISEALEAYRWIRREDPGYRDVTQRIQQLSSRRPLMNGRKSIPRGSRMKDMFRSWQSLLGISR